MGLQPQPHMLLRNGSLLWTFETLFDMSKGHVLESEYTLGKKKEKNEKEMDLLHCFGLWKNGLSCLGLFFFD